MSALGHKQTLKRLDPMTALPPKADMDQQAVMSALCQKRTHALQQKSIFRLGHRQATRMMPGSSVQVALLS